jgi:hypothetical protein
MTKVEGLVQRVYAKGPNQGKYGIYFNVGILMSDNKWYNLSITALDFKTALEQAKIVSGDYIEFETNDKNYIKYNSIRKDPTKQFIIGGTSDEKEI